MNYILFVLNFALHLFLLFIDFHNKNYPNRDVLVNILHSDFKDYTMIIAHCKNIFVN